MATGLIEILLTATFFLLATFGIGLIPIFYVNRKVSNEDKYVVFLSLFGIGMLLGTSFMLVIPEGVHACLQNDGNVGLNLLIGFLAVYLLDKLVKWVGSSSYATRWGSLSNERPLSSLKDMLNIKKTTSLVLKNNVVFALVIHGFSDGVALGASSGNDSLKVIMLVAIIIHKIPAVLSLTSLMISKQKLEKLEVISNLFAFAASTPLGYLIVSLLNLKDFDAMEWLSGNLLLMSGGSLLYASFTAFLGGDNHNHNGDDYVMVNTLEENSATENVNLADIEMIPETALKLKYDDSVYILSGVVIPVVISFFVGDD